MAVEKIKPIDTFDVEEVEKNLSDTEPLGGGALVPN
jgi:hypothetical protein